MARIRKTGKDTNLSIDMMNHSFSYSLSARVAPRALNEQTANKSRKQLAHRFAAIEDLDGPAFGMHQPAVRIDADGFVDRVGDIGRCNWTARNESAAAIGRPQHQPAARAGAGEEQRGGWAPVVAA